MFNRKLSDLLVSLYLARAAALDACAPCGSAANSSNPYGDMNKLLQTGGNCQAPYNPLAPQTNQYGYGNGGEYCMSPGYYQQMNNQTGYSQSGYSQSGYPGMNNSGIGKDQECEVTTSIECKPKRGGQNSLSGNLYGSNFSIPMNSTVPGAPTTRPSTVPGSNNQTCDCSQFMGGMTNYSSNSQSFDGSNMGGCDCSQFFSQGGGNGQQLLGGNTTTPIGGNFSNQTRPLYCGNNGENGGRGGSFDNGFFGGRTSGSVFGSFDCSRPQTYQPLPIKTAIIGTSELPISDDIRVTASSCGPAPCL